MTRNAKRHFIPHAPARAANEWRDPRLAPRPWRSYGACPLPCLLGSPSSIAARRARSSGGKAKSWHAPSATSRPRRWATGGERLRASCGAGGRRLGVGRMDSPGSRRLILAASEKGAAASRGVELPPAQVERRRRTARELNLGRNLRPGWHGRRWTEEEIALLGRLPDAEVARRTGWGFAAVGCSAACWAYRGRRGRPGRAGRMRRRFAPATGPPLHGLSSAGTSYLRGSVRCAGVRGRPSWASASSLPWSAASGWIIPGQYAAQPANGKKARKKRPPGKPVHVQVDRPRREQHEQQCAPMKLAQSFGRKKRMFFHREGPGGA